jgi:Leucine Rich repeat
MGYQSKLSDRDSLPMATDASTPDKTRRRRFRRRLRILLGVGGPLILLVIFSQLDPSVVRKLGPAAESLYDLLSAPADRELTVRGQHMVDDLKAVGGYANVIERTPGFIGPIGRKELFSIEFPAPSMGKEVDFNDEDLALLVKRYGDRIWGIHLGNTKVTDEGLRSLQGLSHIRNLGLGEEGPWDFSRHPLPEASRITDAGLAHLAGLKQLQTLHIRGLVVTDAGLESLAGLTGMHALALSRTRVQGPGLASLRSLPMLGYLELDGSTVTGKGLGFLSSLKSLGILSLKGVPLTDEGLTSLKALPSLNNLDIHGSGLSDDQVKDLQKSNPKLKIER